jgi:hypothetical protein
MGSVLTITQFETPGILRIARRLNCVAINFSTAGLKLGQFQACALGSDALFHSEHVPHLKNENPSVLHCLDLNPRFYRRHCNSPGRN